MDEVAKRQNAGVSDASVEGQQSEGQDATALAAAGDGAAAVISASVQLGGTSREHVHAKFLEYVDVGQQSYLMSNHWEAGAWWRWLRRKAALHLMVGNTQLHILYRAFHVEKAYKITRVTFLILFGLCCIYAIFDWLSDYVEPGRQLAVRFPVLGLSSLAGVAVSYTKRFRTDEVCCAAQGRKGEAVGKGKQGGLETFVPHPLTNAVNWFGCE